MTPTKKPTMAQWLQAAMTHANEMSQAELARQIEQRISAGFDRSKVQKMLAGAREMSAVEMLAIEEITGYPAPTAANDFTTIPFVEWTDVAKLAAKGARLPAASAKALSFSGLGHGEFFATKVEGDAMERLSPAGSVIVVDRNARQLESGACYILSVDGVTTFRMYRAGDISYFAPYSTDLDIRPVLPNDGQRWSVVGRVRRSVLDL
jgi:SOS-response transcriptional repressor LexA